MLGSPAGAHTDPSSLGEDGWLSAPVPGTVAMALSAHGEEHRDYDARDWWYRCDFSAPPEHDGSREHVLVMDGLATLAEVWLNGERVLESRDMFLRHRVNVTASLEAENQLVVVFRSLQAALGERHPRPRWKTSLVRDQALRWYRTTLLGRIPGWTPPLPPVGPWRAIYLEEAPAIGVEGLRVSPQVARDGKTSLRVTGNLGLQRGLRVQGLAIRVGGAEHPLRFDADSEGGHVEETVSVTDVPLWWPHTLGAPSLVTVTLVAETSDGRKEVPIGDLGFRRVEVDTHDGRIQYHINGARIFCRGACWTPTDTESLDGDETALRDVLARMVAAGANMVRVGGTMTYESDAFYRICDELGIMVWQDFMFANMDYPVEDDDFLALVTEEARQELLRLSPHPSVVTWCGGSEVEQQAAMFGASRDIWTNALFSEVLPRLVDELHATATYWPSTPTGGAFPFHTREGLTHYYGVGAYLRPLDDVRTAGVRFTPETLGFSNVPEPEVVQSITPHGPVPPHHPEWKRGVPRDSGAGWDFEDVRDHYLSVLEGCDPMELRYSDLERYWALSRVVPGRLMERVFREWRAQGEDGCGGGLVWFIRDLVPGAGWGILDHTGAPKAVYYYLRRAWAPRTVSVLDRGLDGFDVAVVNETASALRGAVRLTVLDRGRVVTAEEQAPVEVAEGGRVILSADRVFGRFMDLTHAYRFGPQKHEAIAAELLDEAGEVLARDVVRVHPERSVEARIDAELSRTGDGRLAAKVSSEDLAYGVRISVRDYLPDDNYVTLLPGRVQTIALTPTREPGTVRGSVDALNATMPVRLTISEA